MPLALAASVAVCAVVLVFALGVFDRAPPPVVYATGPDQRDTVRLGDGSQLVLNADTTVAVRMGDNPRALVLETGEVMLDRTRVVWGKGGSVCGELGGGR